MMIDEIKDIKLLLSLLFPMKTTKGGLGFSILDLLLFNK